MQKTGLEIGISDIAGWKRQYDEAYTKSDYSNFSGYACVFSEVLPTACCGAFQPEVDFSGKQLQLLGRRGSALEHVAINLAPVDGRTILTIGWFGRPGGAAESFAKSFTVLDDSAKANAAMHLAFEHLENTYMRPSWWEQLNEQTRDKLIRRARTGVGADGPDRGTSTFLVLDPILSTAMVEDEVFLTKSAGL